MTRNQKIKELKALFLQRYKDAKSELNYTNIYELLVAVVLSAQCTDKRVNLVTPEFFTTYPSPKELSTASVEEVAKIIKSISFFNNKAKNLVNMAKAVQNDFGGEIPSNQADLKSLSGVGQKSANVILSEFFGSNILAVDTHVFRVSHRLGLSKAKNVRDTESELTKIFKDNLHILHQAFVLFGRYECKALRPLCESCFVKKYCVDSRSFKAV